MRGGEGESQLEGPPEKVRERIDKIQRDLELVMRQRDVRVRGANATSGRWDRWLATPTPASLRCSMPSPGR